MISLYSISIHSICYFVVSPLSIGLAIEVSECLPYLTKLNLFYVHLQGCKCVVFVPENMVAARREAIEREGAEVFVVRGNYDDAIAQV